jgi:hypothetical protein
LTLIERKPVLSEKRNSGAAPATVSGEITVKATGGVPLGRRCDY